MTRDTLIKILNEASGAGPFLTPTLQCDFELQIISHVSKRDVLDFTILTAFNIPEYGVSWSMSNETLFFPIPNVNVQSANIAFLLSGDSDRDRLLFKAQEEQYNDSGILKQPKDRIKYDAKFILKRNNNAMTICELEDCLFSVPIPSISPKTAEPTEFKMNIAYKNIKQGSLI